jgi:hypothetical protein
MEETTMLPRSYAHLYIPGEPGWTDPNAEQAAQDSADAAMAALGCKPTHCEVCGARMYVLDGAPGPFQCNRPDCGGC